MHSFSSPPESKYWVFHQGETQGPFDQNFIDAMVMAQVYSPSVLVCIAGTKEWIPYKKFSAPIPVSQAISISNAPTRKLKSPKSISTHPALICGLVIFVAAFVLWIIGQATSSEKSSKLKPNASQFQSTASSRPSTSSSPYSSASKNPPVIIPPVQTGQIFSDAFGNTYRVSDADYYRLVLRKTDLNTKKTRLDLEEINVNADSLRLERERPYLDSSNNYAVDAFNRKVREFNEDNAALQRMVDDFNREVNAFNAELERVGTLIR